MRVDPMMQLNEVITSAVEWLAVPALVLLVVMVVTIGALELRSRLRGPVKGKRGDRVARVAPSAR
jgi:hypothetical protein